MLRFLSWGPFPTNNACKLKRIVEDVKLFDRQFIYGVADEFRRKKKSPGLEPGLLNFYIMIYK
jgi:hypothetical protein